MTSDELGGENSNQGRDVQSDALLPADVAAVIVARYPYTRPAQVPSRFAVGGKLKTRNMHPTGHTRMPRYARGRTGTVVRIHGCMVFPDSTAFGKGEDPQWCYSVQSDARELWGREADPTVVVCLDLWEPYFDEG